MRQMPIDSRSFYGVPVPTVKRFKAAGTDDGWHTFSLQEAAFRFLSEARDGAGLLVWSLETDAQGARRYIVATLADFWRRYRTLQPNFRHYYEVIVAGTPCHLYLDLEYHRGSNPQADGELMVRTLRTELAAALGERFDAALAEGSEWVEMDSSTDSKFSRHLILRLQDAAFWDNQQLGAFVQSVCTQLDARRATEPLIAALW
eukprot:1299374-Prymnesium_polylepis.1